MSFRGVDFLSLDELLTEEERMVRDTVRQFISKKFLPIIAEHNQAATFPHELVPELAELGVFGPNIPGYGSPELGDVAYGLVMQELERGDSGLRSFASVQGALVMYPISAYGSEAHKEQWLGRLRRADAIGCFGLTEPNFGSDPGGMQTRADDRGDHYELNGAKMWITNGTLADVAVVWAKLYNPDGELQGIRGFLVEKGTKGFSAQDIHNKLSLRASVTSELLLQGCRIPKENLLPKSAGLKSALGCLSHARYGIGWGVIGAMMAVYDEALSYGQQRVQWGRPIAGFQLVQRKLVEMITEISKAQLLALRIGRLKEAGKCKHYHISMLKRNNVSKALEMARMARDILGGNGITDDFQAMRHMCNLETVYTYEGTHDIHTLILGKHITGLSALGDEG